MKPSNRDVREIVRVAEHEGWDEVQLRIGEWRLVLAKEGKEAVLGVTELDGEEEGERGKQVGGALTKEEKSEEAGARTPRRGSSGSKVGEDEAKEDEGGSSGGYAEGEEGEVVRVKSPVLGVFYRAPEPGAAPFVEVGDVVEVEDTVCIIEVMKLMHHLKAEVKGRVIGIHAKNGEMVEYGEEVISIKALEDE